MKVKSILIGVLIGIIALPTISLGGTFVSSLIDGKSVDEAVRILADQLDNLIGRVEIIETKQAEQDQFISEFQSLINKNNIPALTTIPESNISVDEALRLETLKSEILKLTVPIDVSIPDLKIEQ